MLKRRYGILARLRGVLRIILQIVGQRVIVLKVVLRAFALKVVVLGIRWIHYENDRIFCLIVDDRRGGGFKLANGCRFSSAHRLR